MEKRRWRVSHVEEVTLISMSLREREEPGMTVGSGLGQWGGYDAKPWGNMEEVDMGGKFGSQQTAYPSSG